MSGFLQSMFWFARGLGRDKEGAVPGVAEAAVKSVGARIGDACNDEGAAFRPLAKAWLAEDTGLSERVVQRAVGRLKDLGILAVEEHRTGRGHAPVYSIDVDRLLMLVPRERLPKGFARHLPEVEPEVPETDQEKKGDTMSPFSEERETPEAERETPATVKGGVSVSPQQTTTINTTTPRASAGEGRGPRRASGRGSGKTKPRSANDGEAEPPKPPSIPVPAGWEGQLIEAALASKDCRMPWKLKPWLGRFRLLEIEDSDGRWQRKLAVDGIEHDFRSVFTGAMIALECRDMQIYFPAFAAKQIAKGKARWVNTEISPKWFVEVLRAVAPANEGVRRHG